jgi:type II secretory pathway pseudopilin PulG
MAKTSPGKRWIVIGAVAAVALCSFAMFSGGCKKETASEQAGREAREAYEKSKVLLKEGYDKSAEAAKQGVEASKEAAKDFQKGWSEGAKKEGGK